MVDFTAQRMPSRIRRRRTDALMTGKTSIYDIPFDGEVVLTLDGACIQSIANEALKKLVDGFLSDRVAGLNLLPKNYSAS